MKEVVNDEISKSIDENIKYIKELLEGNSDMVFREFLIGDKKAFIMYIDGMADKDLLNDYVLESLMLESEKLGNISDIKNRISNKRYESNDKCNVNDIKNKILTVTDVSEKDKLSKAIDLVLSGDTLLLIEGMDKAYVIATRLWPVRGVGEPESETTIKGSRDGFTETIRFNTALVRRRIKDTRLKIKSKTLGVRSKTDMAIIYIEDIVNQDVLNNIYDRLEKIDIDAILGSGYIEHLIEDGKWSLFPTTRSTERPDVVASALYEGKVAILVDNSPFAIIVPTTLPSLFQSPDDYYEKWIHSSIIRIIRLFSIIISIILPSMYVAVTSYHSDIIPTKLAYFIAASREGVPFPAYMEALIMEFSLAFLMESIIRLPKPIGATIGIVGGLIIGQAAVSAGIVSPIMIIIVSITTITSFTAPSYDASLSFRIIRFLLIIVASFLGLYGIILGLIVLLIHLVRLKSFGIPYLSPMVNPSISDFKDMYIRAPIRFFKKRPDYMKTRDKIRQR
ncbi:spore germination protein [Clostridium botulinum]|uniref:spore germination protein n=1 Tax=Clostridium botulinum TaxID=1491 RepID=UPI000774C8CA|nr:spore germination protein [Clostridium botulinum]MBY6952598.1 spore germination protein [Clostridium botulinum]MCR1140166.1 spore germination protein [Clostridium botulinum]NEZ79390.1 spore germination protein [Clostridium botulinum]NFA16076.1 spore germination protein [Clostridium botulinum]NFA53985.1 spore germination protein [Clostridium botulinum]